MGGSRFKSQWGQNLPITKKKNSVKEVERKKRNHVNSNGHIQSKIRLFDKDPTLIPMLCPNGYDG